MGIYGWSKRYGFYPNGSNEQSIKQLEINSKENIDNFNNKYDTFYDFCLGYLLPLALEAGMRIDDFWHDDEQYVYLTIRAYENRINHSAWYNGVYFRLALYEVLSFMFGSSKSNAKKIFPEKPFELDIVEEKTKDLLLSKEEKFRKRNLNWY